MRLRCSISALVFGCWELSHVIFLMLRKKELLAKLNKFTNWQLFSLKMVLGCRLSESSCHFVNLHSFASSSFFLSVKKITWLNSQKPKTRQHVQHPSWDPPISVPLAQCSWVPHTVVQGTVSLYPSYRNVGAGGGLPPRYWQINPIQTRWADYALHIHYWLPTRVL